MKLLLVRLASIAALMCVDCSSLPPAADAGGDVTAASDTVADTNVPNDTSPIDAAPSDAVHPADNAAPADAPTPIDVAPDAATCVPSSGSTTMTSECDQVQLAILRNGNAATAAISGRINVGSFTMPPCAIVDSIDVVSAGNTIASIPGTSNSAPADGATYALATGPATVALTQLCASDTGRFDGVGLVVHGHVDGGTFTAMCGNNTQDVGWPPRVVLTCHTGLSQAPFPSDGTVMSSTFMGMTLTNDQIFGLVPQPPALATVDPSVYVIPGVSSFSGGAPMSPRNTTGWMGAASTMMEPDGSSASNVSLFNTTDVLGPQLCPPGCTMPPCGVSTPPVFIARITGTAATGAFESELYVSNCVTEP